MSNTMLVPKAKIPFRDMMVVGLLPAFMKKLLYRIKGYKLGRNVSIGIGTVIIGKNVTIGDNVTIGNATVIRAKEINIERFVAIGSFTVIDSGKIRIGEDARINEQVIIGGMKTPQSSLDLGKRTIIMEYSFINTTMPVKIGDDTGIGGHCLLFTHGSWLNQLDGFPVTFAPITLGKNVWLPWRVFIMPGVTIGDKVVIGANSLITKSFESNCLIAGSPAKIVRENYPPQVPIEQKSLIFENILNDFVKYLEYNDISISKNQDDISISFTGQTKNTSFELIICKSQKLNLNLSKKDSLIIFNITNDWIKLPETLPKNTMYLDIFNKQRIGSSNIGEEFVKFLSRYGLRFSRID